MVPTPAALPVPLGCSRTCARGIQPRQELLHQHRRPGQHVVWLPHAVAGKHLRHVHSCTSQSRLHVSVATCCEPRLLEEPRTSRLLTLECVSFAGEVVY